MAEGVYSQLVAANKLHEAERKQKTELNRQIREQERLKEERENANFFERLGATALDFFTELGGGLGKGLEGVVDAAVSIAGEVGSWFGADTQWAEDIVKFDAAQEWWYNWEDKVTNKSYLNDATMVKDVVRGVGQQLPAIALNFIPGAGTALSMTYLGLSAGGSGAEEALNDGANLDQAVGYGLVQSLIEYATEAVTAGMGKGMYSVGKSAAKTVGQVAREEFISEGIEEGLSALVNPLSKTIYQGKDALDAYKDLTFYLDAGEQALVGAIVGGIIGGSSAGIQRYSAGSRANFLIEQSVREIQTLDVKADNLFTNNKLTQSNLNDINTRINTELQNISTQLQGMTQQERLATINKYGLSTMFNENGQIITQNTNTNANTVQGEQFTEQAEKTARKPLISDNIEAYSPSLRNTELVFAPTSNALTESARNAKRFIGALNPNAKIVIAESLFENTNAFYDTNSKIFYFTNNATTQEIVGHEFTHSLEGTKAYKNLADYILSSTENIDQRLAEKIEQYKDVNTEIKQGENGEDIALYEAQTELVAEEMGRILSDQAAAERIINQNKSVAHRIWQWIKDTVAKITKRGKTGELYDYMRRVENLFAKAIRNSVGGISLSQVAAIAEFERQAREAENATLDKSDNIRYNKSVKYISYDAVGTENIANIKAELANIYADSDNAVADSIAIESGNNLYVVDSGKENGDLQFGVRRIITIADEQLRALNKEKINDRAIQNGHVSDELFGKIRNASNNGGGSRVGQQLQEELSTNSRKSNNKQRGVSDKNGDNGSNRYSLKDSVEQDVVKKYGTTRKWTETGYILQDGTLVDLSGKNNGGPGNYRAIDHRDVFETYEDSDTYGTDAMIEFMSRGNIRVLPEYPGINLQVEPTDTQYGQIEDLIEKLGWKEKNFSVDFDDAKGNTVATLTYENNISARKIIADIKYYFKEGKLPHQSDLSKFRYSLKDSKGNAISTQQAEFFKDSKVRDENGNLLVVYHGTNANFNIFDSTRSEEGNGAYWFSKSREYAEEIAHLRKGQNIGEYYVNVKNPLVVEMSSKDFADSIKEKPYIEQALKENRDGVIFQENKSDGETFYAVFEPNQIKAIDNRIPTSNNDIRYSLKDGEGNYNYSKGQIAKYIAEHSKNKAYARTDAEQIINTVVSNQLAFGEKYGEISGKTKNQVIDMLWHSLNTKNEGYRANAALDIADYIINNAVMEDIYSSSTNEADIYVVNTLRQYLHNVDLDSIKGEIKYHYDDNNSPYLLWGKRKGTQGSGSPDTIAQELAESGIRFQSSNPSDIFFEMDEMYRNAVKNLKKAAKVKLNSVLDSADVKSLRQSIAREILQGYDETGHKTRFAETLEKYTSKISQLKQAVRDIKAYNLAKNNAVSTIERLRDEFIKNRPAGWKIPQQVVDFVKKISRVETWRNNISKTARQYLYELQSQIDNVLDPTQQEIYPFRETLKELGDLSKGEMTTEELRTLDVVLRQFAWQLRNYDKVAFEGKEQSNTELAQQGVNETRQAQEILRNGSNPLIKFKNKVYTNPYDRLAEMGLYRKNSITMRLYAEMLEGDRNRASFVRDANELFADFFKNNKNYLNELQSEITVSDGNNKLTLTKRQALSLYATSLREQGRSHLFNISDSEGVIRLLDNKYSTRGDMAEAFARGKDVRITRNMINDIRQQLTATDTEYMELVKKFFNENSKQAKKATDQKLYGITNIEDDYYYPLKVSNDKIYTEAGQNNNNINQYVLEMGMNKSIKPNAQNKIVIDGIDNVIATHIQNMSLYYGFAVPLTAYNRIMNKQVLSNVGEDTTSNMRAEIQKIDVDFEKYMNKLWQDIQGITRSDRGFISSLLSKIRWAGANSALGANPKVLVTQTLSLAAGVAEFNPKYIAKGMAHFFGETQKAELAKYSSLMWERMQIGNSVDIADIRQVGKEIGSKFGKVGAKITQALNTFTTKPISWMDSNVIQSLWFAAQYEVADTRGKGYEFGTEANKIEAGKRVDEVVFRTQQTSDALGRSEWMRSQNEIVKFARMFTGDAVQLTGRLIASVNKYNIAKKMVKSGNTEISQQGQAMLREAKVGIAKSASAFLLNQALLLAVAMAFKWIKGKNDDEEWSDIAQNEAIANMVGLLPFGGDIYDKLLGYEPTNMAYTALSNTVEIVQDLYDGAVSLISGDYVDDVKRNAAIRKSVLSISRLTGIPLQNLESYVKGVVGKFSPATKEQYEALFKTKTNVTYLKKIKAATENGDEDLADAIINIMFDSKTGKIRDDKVLAVTRDLIEKGYDVLPKNVNEKISYEGKTYTLTNRQYKQFKKIYSQATDAVKSMVNNVSFNKLDDEAKAKAMTFVYDYYYDLALEDLLGVDLEEKNLLFAQAIPIEQLAMAVAQARLYEADQDKNGNSITGSRKAKVQAFVQSLRLSAKQKYMIMGYLGYTNKLGANLVKNYIQRLKLTKEQKEQLYLWSGYKE